MAVYPWVVPYKRQGQKLEDFSNLKRWYEAVGARPAVRRALGVGKELRRPIEELSQEARDVLFGNKRRAQG